MPFNSGRRWAWVYAFIGVFVGLLSIFHILIVERSPPLVHLISFTLFTLGMSAAILYGAYYHYRNPLPSQRYWRINVWIFIGGIFISSVGIISLYIGSSTVTTVELIESVQLMMSIGLGIGFLIGSLEAQTLENTEAAAKAETLENERERLELLNDLLRHYVLNGVTVIEGFSEQLESSTDGTQRESAQTIRERAENMATIVKYIGILTRSEWGDSESTRVEIQDSIEDNFKMACKKETDLETPEKSTTMHANVGYEDAIQLISEGVCQAVGEVGLITVEENPHNEFISIEARPVEQLDRLREEFHEPVGSEIGLELFLAKKILEPAIELELSTTGEDGIEIVLKGEFVDE